MMSNNRYPMLCFFRSKENLLHKKYIFLVLCFLVLVILGYSTTSEMFIANIEKELRLMLRQYQSEVPVRESYIVHNFGSAPVIAQVRAPDGRIWKDEYTVNISNNSIPVSLLNLAKNITIVTAYFNLGKFEKGGPGNMYTPKKYLNWMAVFSKILNPVIIYVDTEDTFKLMHKLRKNKPGKIFLTRREDLWSFQLKNKIAKIYSQKGYAKHKPNTVVPEYSCAMHAKFELLNNSINANYFDSNYFMWLDIGLFRDIAGTKTPFGLLPPPDYDQDKVAYSQVWAPNFNLSLRDLVFQNRVWVGGASNFAHKSTMRNFVEQYKRTVDMFIQNNLMSTDQQILYGMFSKEGQAKNSPHVKLQLYHSGWFKLGYLCKEMWDKKIANFRTFHNKTS